MVLKKYLNTFLKIQKFFNVQILLNEEFDCTGTENRELHFSINNKRL